MWLYTIFDQAWLNDSANVKMTWHTPGTEPNEWSDAVVFVDPSLCGDGSDSDGVMPEKYWDKIVELCQEHFRPSTGFHVIVRMTNLQE